MWDNILAFLFGFIPTTTTVIYYLLARKWRRDAIKHAQVVEGAYQIADAWEHMYRAQRAENANLRYERRVESMEMDRVLGELDTANAVIEEYDRATQVLMWAVSDH